jgi:hypothetical protein
MSAPLISVCLPTFNGAKYIAAAIESVLGQTYQNFEVIVTDDGSQDQTLLIVEEFSKTDKRVKLFRNQQRLGAVKNYNHSVHSSNGSFIKPFAQDELLGATNLARCVETLIANPDLSFVTTAKDWIDELDRPIMTGDGYPRAVTQYFDGDERINYLQTLRSCFSTLTNWVGAPSTLLFRREVFQDGFSPEFSQLMDLEFFLRLLQKGDAIYIAERLGKFRLHAESQSSLTNGCPRACTEWAYLAAKHFDGLGSAGYPFSEFCDLFVTAFAERASIDPALSKRFSEFGGTINAESAERDLATALMASATTGAARNLTHLAAVQKQVQELESRLRDSEPQKKALAKALEMQPSLDQLEELHSKKTELQIQLQVEANSRAKLEDELISMQTRLAELESELKARKQTEHELAETLEVLGNSASWKLTEPLRVINRYLSSANAATRSS